MLYDVSKHTVFAKNISIYDDFIKLSKRIVKTIAPFD